MSNRYICHLGAQITITMFNRDRHVEPRDSSTVSAMWLQHTKGTFCKGLRTEIQGLEYDVQEMQ